MHHFLAAKRERPEITAAHRALKCSKQVEAGDSLSFNDLYADHITPSVFGVLTLRFSGGPCSEPSAARRCWAAVADRVSVSSVRDTVR